jgi:tetratricopeptide (TPR) repeat protein
LDIAGTLRYLAPECIEGKVSPQSDIYALGLTLYELLTLEQAFQSKTQASLLKDVLEQNPVSIFQIDPQISKDLEAITAKAISKNPDLRYPSAKDFAEDLGKYLSGTPTEARPISLVERTVLWSRRNPLASGLSLLIFFLLFLVASISTVSYFKLSSSYTQLDNALTATKESNQRVQSERTRAEENLQIALTAFDEISIGLASKQLPQSLDFSATEDYSDIALVGLSQDDVLVIESLLKFYAEFEENNQEIASTDLSTSKLHERMGTIYSQLGEFEEANGSFKKALQALSDSESHSLDSLLDQVRILNLQGKAYRLSGDLKSASLSLEESLSTLSKISASETSPLIQLLTVKTLNELIKNRSTQYVRRTQLRGPRKRNHELNALENLSSDKEFKQALKIITDLINIEPENPEYLIALAHCYRNILPLVWRAEYETAQEYHEKSIEILKKLSESQPDSKLYAYEYADILAISEEYKKRSNLSDESVQHLKESIRISQKLHSKFPTSFQYALLLASSHRKLGIYQMTIQKLDDSDKNLTGSEQIFEQLRSLYPSNRTIHTELARLRINLSDLARRRGDLQHAKLILTQALEEYELFLETQPSRKPNNPIISILTRHLEGRNNSVAQ